MNPRPRVTVVFDNLGPYHLARLRGAAAVCDLVALQAGAASRVHLWKGLGAPGDGLEIRTVVEEGASGDVDRRTFRRRLRWELTKARPGVVFVPGWSGRAAFETLLWCLEEGVPAVAMSESTAWDAPRGFFKEWVKRRIVGCFTAALAGGTPHRDYLVRLGMDPAQVFFGYDAVDNAHFAVASRNGEEGPGESPSARPFFLAGGRLVNKKNFHGLLAAYAEYRRDAAARGVAIPGEDGTPVRGEPEGAFDPAAGTRVWDLVVFGDGELRRPLEEYGRSLAVGERVRWAGTVDYQELPRFYARAGAFVHVSTTEQWGLVVNEAMAAGLPVIVSSRCGCAPDLVRHGRNGFVVNPNRVEEIAEAMRTVATLGAEHRQAMGDASARIIGDWGVDRFRQGFRRAVDAALAAGARRTGAVESGLLRALARQ